MFPPQACFTCARCKRPFPTGERVTFTGKSCLCQACIQVVASSLLSPSSSSWQHDHHNDNIYVQGDKDSGGIGSRSQIGNVGDDTCAGYQLSTINYQPPTINVVGVILHVSDPPGRDHGDVVVPLVLEVGATSLDEKSCCFLKGGKDNQGCLAAILICPYCYVNKVVWRVFFDWSELCK